MSDIIALCGYAQSGKDTVAEIMSETGWKRKAFADPIRDALYVLNPKIVAHKAELTLRGIVDAYGWDRAKVDFPEIRRLLQVFGTEVAREQWSDSFWIDLAMKDISNNPGLWVITDCRFPNEVEALRKHGAKIWKIYRPGVGPVNAHASDNYIGQIEPDWTVYNGGTLEELRENVALTLDASFRPMV